MNSENHEILPTVTFNTKNIYSGKIETERERELQKQTMELENIGWLASVCE